MCGIAGFLSLEPRPSGQPARAGGPGPRHGRPAAASADPTTTASWVDPAAGIALGFRRLAIVDLSPAGRQPMESASGRYVIVFNGEIYNHAELRRRLIAADGPLVFRGHSDTEVLLAAIEAWGLRKSLEEAVGMFAIAVWDRKEQTLSLARDRVGEKPLYYGVHNRTLLFGSELKALSVHPAFVDRIDRDALALFLEFGYIPAPYSIYERIAKLPPGSLVELPAAALRLSTAALPAPVAYWSAKEVVEAATAHRFSGSFERSRRRAGAADSRDDRRSDGGRRAGRCVSVRRHRFVADRGADADAKQPPREDLHHRFSRIGVQRSDARQAGRPAPGDRSHRTLRHARGSPGRDPLAADDLRRAVRRFIADSDAFGLAIGPPARHGQPVGRRRRRAVRRLHALSAHRDLVEV